MKKKSSKQLDKEIAAALRFSPVSNGAPIQPKKHRAISHLGWPGGREMRQALDASSSVPDTEMDPMQIASIASDAYESGQKARSEELLANIPPVVLGKTKYRVVHGGRHGLDLVGPRGGTSHLVISLSNPDLWAHNTGGGSGVKTVWYRRNPDFTFTRVD